MIIGISLTKSVPFRGADQEFSNVYHYLLDTAVTAPWQSIVDELVAFEKSIHSQDVTFVRAQGWKAGGTPADNTMEHQEELTGTGTASAMPAAMDRERAFLFRWPAGADVRGKPVYLRKWYHTCGTFGGIGYTPSDAVLQNVAEIPSVIRDSLADVVSAVNEVGGTEAWDLCAPSGRTWQAQPQCHRYLEHHQLGDMWR